MLNENINTASKGGMGFWGVPLNLLGLRMLYAVSVTIKAAKAENNFESSRNTKKVAGVGDTPLLPANQNMLENTDGTKPHQCPLSERTVSSP